MRTSRCVHLLFGAGLLWSASMSNGFSQCVCKAIERQAACPVPGGAIRSTGVSQTGADEVFHQKGYLGRGVRVGVIDSGYKGLESSLSACELPSLSVCDCTEDQLGFDHGRPVQNPLAQVCKSTVETNHGTSVAEVVHDMAPEAEITLYRTDTPEQFSAALDHAAKNGIRIVVQSRSYLEFSYPGEPAYPAGRGPMNEAVQKAERDGILFVASAGNYGESHYEGVFRDGDRDGYHDFLQIPLRDESIDLRVSKLFGGGYSVEAIAATLTWSAWDDNRSSRSEDFKIVLGHKATESAPSYTFLASSSAVGGNQPAQRLFFTPSDAQREKLTFDGYYALAIFRTSTAPVTSNVRVRLYGSCGITFRPWIVRNFVDDFSFFVPEGSLGDPAYSSAALTVGELDNGIILKPANTSSRGRKSDVLVKPDLLAISNVKTSVDGNFGGTSAAAPHVAGAAALIAGAFPDLDNASIRRMLLEGAAFPASSSPRPNNIIGHGVLSLRAIQTPDLVDPLF